MLIRNKEQHFKSLEGKSYQGRLYNRGAILSGHPAVPIRNSHVVSKAQGRAYYNSLARQQFLEGIFYPKRRLCTNHMTRNDAAGYDAATLADFVAETMLDIQRLADDMEDYSSTLYNILSRPDATKKVSLVDLLPFVGKAGKFDGTGDLPGLMEHRLGTTADIPIELYGFGDKTMLNEILWSPNYDQIALSAARIIADERNALVFKPMVTASYDSYHSVALQANSALGPAENKYETLLEGYKKLLELKNPLTGRKIYNGEFETTLYVSKIDAIAIRPIAEGSLKGAGGVRIIADPLPIDTFVEYSCGLNDGEAYQGETLSYPGIPKGEAYLAAKTSDGAQLIKKVDWTMEVEPASSQIKGEEKYWWTAYGKYNDNVLPATQGSNYYGAIIKIALE